MPLDEYKRRRDFSRTPEPAGGRRPPRGQRPSRRAPPLSFVVQKHAARRLHYDVRLEMEGVLRSWAVPKGPSLRPGEKRLAVHVEDHPIEYGDFEGVIPAGQYGGGTVLLWDRGIWIPEGDPVASYRKGKLKFRLEGEKLHGGWTLVRMGGHASEGGKNWLLLKERDEEAIGRGAPDVTESEPASVDSGRTLEEIAEERDRVWDSHAPGGGAGARRRAPERGATAAKSSGRGAAKKAEKKTAKKATKKAAQKATKKAAKKAALPREPRPQLATLHSTVPEGEDWVHEIKYDGYRLLARVEDGAARVLTRRGNDWTERFPGIVRAAAALPVRSALIDGEAVVLVAGGVSSFQALQEALGNGRPEGEIVFFAFDLLHLDGLDVSGAPLLERKALLAELLAPAGEGPEGQATIRFSDHVRGRGRAFHERACALGLEGIVAKRAQAPYRPGRGDDWRKIKCQKRQEFVVGGWTEPQGSRTGLGALLLGVHEDGGLRPAGKVGTGFTERDLRALLARLRPLERADPPFASAGSARGARGGGARGVHWVEPELVVEIEFTEWTRDGQLRHPSFKGVREDKPAAEVTRERPLEEVEAAGAQEGTMRKRGKGRAEEGTVDAAETSVLGVRLTSPGRVLWPEQGVTKLALARYYERVAEHMLPYVARRPLSLVRCPRGAGAPCFFQKHPGDQVPDVLGRVDIEEKRKTSEYVYVEDVAGLIALVQIGTLEIHGWGSRIDRLEHPDLMIFDLDPDPTVGWERVVEAAYELRERLEALGLASWVKTTGGKGLHVVVPLSRRQDFDEVKEFSRLLAERMVKDDPARYVATMSKAKRKGRIFVDYLRNGRGSTAIMPFSTRVREAAPVSVPIRWEELERGVRADQLTVETLPRRLGALRADPWEGFREVRQSLTRRAWRALE